MWTPEKTWDLLPYQMRLPDIETSVQERLTDRDMKSESQIKSSFPSSCFGGKRACWVWCPDESQVEGTRRVQPQDPGPHTAGQKWSYSSSNVHFWVVIFSCWALVKAPVGDVTIWPAHIVFNFHLPNSNNPVKSEICHSLLWHFLGHVSWHNHVQGGSSFWPSC